MKHVTVKFSRYTAAAILSAGILGSGMSSLAWGDDAAAADAAPAPTKHQLMKDCMRKQKAAISGRPNYELSADCKDITKTEKQNADAEKKADDKQEDKGG